SRLSLGSIRYCLVLTTATGCTSKNFKCLKPHRQCLAIQFVVFFAQRSTDNKYIGYDTRLRRPFARDNGEYHE
ncbi:MAG: hypothetical protein CSA45_06315, partial [Gammaproteobacteria bacterium]